MSKSGNIKDRYKPYNYSENKCHVIALTVISGQVTKIDENLPAKIKTLTGVYVTSTINVENRVFGYLFLMLNDGALKSIQLPVLNSKKIRHHSHPFPLNEEIKKGSTLMGHYRDILNFALMPYKITIYLHYK